MLWWVFAKGGLLRFSSLWRAILLFTATGLFFLPVIGSAWAGWALVLVSIAQTLVVMLFWTMLADVAHHSRTSPYVIFGSGWIAYSLPFALGELAGKAEGLHGAGSAVLLALAYLLTIAAVFALNEANFSQRRIFADLEGPAPERSMFASIDEGCERLGSQGASPRAKWRCCSCCARAARKAILRKACSSARTPCAPTRSTSTPSSTSIRSRRFWT